MRPSRDTELDQFKTTIDLRQYAASVGFEFIRRQSSPHSTVMKHPNGDKLVIAIMPSKHFVYFNIHGNDSGSIIDFVQRRDGGSIGDVRKTLRSWNGSGPFTTRPSPTLFPELTPSTHDATRVLVAWMKAREIEGTNQYLQHHRHIPPSTLMDPIFKQRIRTDQRSNVIFPHHNQSGLCGFEVKNHKFTGFSPGGVKGLFYTHPRPTDQIMVVCETVIDLLSVATIEGTNQTRFFSTAGQPSPAQVSLLQSAASKMPRPPRVLLCFDNDEGGREMGKTIGSALHSGCEEVVEHFPSQSGQDWNDVLRLTSNAVGLHHRIV